MARHAYRSRLTGAPRRAAKRQRAINLSPATTFTSLLKQPFEPHVEACTSFNVGILAQKATWFGPRVVSAFVRPLAVVGRPPPGTSSRNTLLPRDACRGFV